MPFFIKQKTIDNQIKKVSDQRIKKVLEDATNYHSNVSNNDPIRNNRTGQGTGADITTGDVFQIPVIINDEQQLEIAYAASWAIAKLIDIPVDDMFLRPRVITNLNDNQLALIEEQYEEFGLTQKIPQFIKNSRTFGSGMMSVISTDDLLINPFNLNNLRQGDIKSFITTNQFSSFVDKFDKSLFSKMFSKPLEYRMDVNGSVSVNFNIHSSRVIKLDAKPPLLTSGWRHLFTGNSRQNGISLIVAAAKAISSEESLYSNTDRLVQRSSVLVAAVDGLKDAMAGVGMDNKECNEIIKASQKLVADMNSESITLIDKDNSISRIEVNFSGLAALFDQNHKRVAAVADISKTRFYNDSATSFFSTGNGEATDHAKLIASMQIRTLQPIYNRIDALLAKNAGINKKIEFNFPSLVELGKKDQAQTSLFITQANSVAQADGSISANEGRDVLREDGGFGNLEGNVPDVVATPEMTTAANVDISKSLNNG